MQALPSPIFIARKNALLRLADELARERVIAVDTEANGMYAYQEQVCLLQFSTPENDYVVDPLALDNLSPLGEIFANPAIEKVFHASEYDLIMLHQDFGFRVQGLFDTMIAARILGWPKVGLGSILKEQFGIEADKHLQRANWGRRPIPPDMLAYAQLDTHYLLPLRERMIPQLKSLGRWEIAQEDFRRASQVDSTHHRNGTDSVWRVRGAYDLTPRQAAVLQELCRYRDARARSLNRPLFKVISDKALIEIARARPRSIQALAELPGVSPRQAQWLGEGLLRAIRRGEKSPPLYPPPRPYADEARRERIERLRRWRQRKARAMNVPSDVILPKDLLHTLAEANPQNLDAVQRILESVPWRREHFGQEIIGVLSASE
ncbi:MAG: ribonuclease D [Anaerolineae bacterium]|nr:MAG: ribonuclease D [Anaerolineae bacterium]